MAMVEVAANRTTNQNPILSLDDTDLDFVLRFVLASGSLKDVARHYGVSYPTLRGRLDRLIDRLSEALEGRGLDPMAEHLADLVEHGELQVTTARGILAFYRKQIATSKTALEES